jgi:zinc transporter
MRESERLYIREFMERTTRIIEELDSIRDRAALLQEEIKNKISDQMNKTIYVLTIVGSIFLPLSFFTGLFGINLAGIPGAEGKFSFYIFSLIIVVLGLTELLIFKKNKWL